MRACLASGVFFIAGLAAARSAPETPAHTPGAPAATRPIVQGKVATPAGAHAAPGSLPKASLPKAPLTAPRSAKAVPATLGGPAKYDARKSAKLGGAVMPHRP